MKGNTTLTVVTRHSLASGIKLLALVTKGVDGASDGARDAAAGSEADAAAGPAMEAEAVADDADET